ncbi:MAG: MMPL family transporter [Thermodesulfobacteriota bacterium]|nr:MMPL family transporter [Thermodesulfobacteriota bacterium]
MKLALTNFSLKYPRMVLLAVLAIVIGFLLQFPKVQFDNDPENMLSAQEPVRIFHHEIKQTYALYDFVIVGVVNKENPAGVFNVATLKRIHRLTEQLLNVQRGDSGLPVIVTPATPQRGEQRLELDLTPPKLWEYWLGKVFSHDPNDLFDDQGRSVILSHELMAPSVVDNIKQSELGSLKLEYLMEQPPQTAAQARQIRDDAMNNPLYRGTLVSEDEKAVCLYIPIVAKPYSYNVASLVRALTVDWPAEDQVLITGLPVAEDTFGVEMLVQMATSAPLAGIAIFLLLLLFFRNLSLIMAPMLVAMFSVVSAMGLLIGLGYDVHIMSSMIAIFLMPIAVADAVHILSEFFDNYSRFGDKGKTVRYVIGHLFRPMLYTSLTTIAGFAALAFTPIPPVQVFGFHVAFGVAVAWLLSMTLIPAYIMVFVGEEKLARTPVRNGATPTAGMLSLLSRMGRFSQARSGMILLTMMILVVGAIYGISRIQVNDNPVKWFAPDHEIRVADDILNHHFGGTYTAYLTLEEVRPQACNCEELSVQIEQQVKARFGRRLPQATTEFTTKLHQLSAGRRHLDGCNVSECFYKLLKEAERLDGQTSAGWNLLADEINYLDSAGLTAANLPLRLRAVAITAADELALLQQQLATQGSLTGEALLDAALAVCDHYLKQSFRAFVVEVKAEATAPPFKQPQMLRYVDGLQEHLRHSGLVGKSTSVVDALKKAGFELSYVAAPSDANALEQAGYAARNRSHYAVPNKAAAAGQIFVQLEGMKKKDSLFHMVTRDYRKANVWIQLKSGDNRDMEAVVQQVENYLTSHPAPVELKSRWAGLTYLNVVWQDKMVRGMLSSLLGSFVVVLMMMTLLFRSVLWGVLAMIPLSVTITIIYGIIGLVGKDYDMPVAVLSSLTLGLSVDFSIHFLQRARKLQREVGDWSETCRVMFQDPARAITRNAITISVGFMPLLLAPLVPYKTVGFFLATIMTVSWLASLLILPALLTRLQRWVFPKKE